MKYLLTADMMKYADKRTIKEFGIPSMVLMERAALQTVAVMEEKNINLSQVLVVCGSGNNGGDGFAIARLLHLKGHKVTVVFAGKEASMTNETKQQRNILERFGVSVFDTFEKIEYSVIIDAVFGIGLSREIEGSDKELIQTLNELCGVKIAVDIPSGVSATTGNVLGIAFCADITVTFAYNKLGLILYPGHTCTGEICTVDIGIPESIFMSKDQIAYTYEKEDIYRLLPKRKMNSNKGSYGKVLLIAGSKGMSGAAYLSAKAAYTMGAGLVHIYTATENRVILQQLLPEAVVTTYDTFSAKEVQKLLDWADVTAIGCGLGTGTIAESILTYAIQNIQKPCLIDADGLNLLALQMELLKGKTQLVLTPHIKELSRLLGCDTKSAVTDRPEKIYRFVNDYPVVCVSKDARTFVAKKGRSLFVNTAGNCAMAKAGSGDVLAGMISGLLAQGMNEYEAGTLGVYIHACAGDYARQKMGSYSVLAQNLIEEAGNVIKEHEEVTERENI